MFHGINRFYTLKKVYVVFKKKFVYLKKKSLNTITYVINLKKTVISVWVLFFQQYVDTEDGISVNG